ncbi:MAG: MFS transporter [Gammaproteobacteria bacterium]|nr:MFS transporter [Gammaproteobacteria bacterium]
MTLKNSLMLAFNKRMLLVYWIGFISGLPLMLTGSILQAWFASENVSLTSIGLITLVGLPYTYKFLWAPVLDKYHLPIPRCTHRRKAWMIFCQFLLAVIVFSMSFLSPTNHLLLIALLAISIAVFSATQDMAIDAYRTEYLRADERGMGSAAFIFAYRLATLVAGGVGLILADQLGWHIYFLGMSILMLLGVLIAYCLPSTTEKKDVSSGFFNIYINPFKAFLTRKFAVWILLFIIFYKFGDAFTQSLGTAFFLRELHLTLSQVGVLYKTVGFFSTILGAYLGGFLLPTLGLYRALLIFGVLQAFANLAFVALALYGAIPWLVIFSVMLELGASGMATVALVAYLMALCDIRYTAAQLALFTAVMTVGRIGAGPLASAVVLHWGWAVMFTLGFIISLPMLGLLPKLKSTIPHG